MPWSENRYSYHPMGDAFMTVDLVRNDMFQVIFQTDPGQLMLKYCKSLNIVLPKSNPVQVPWIGGILNLAGRIQSNYTFQTTFLVAADGSDGNQNALKTLYNWRNLAFGHESGKIGAPKNYKQTADIEVYDVSGETLQFRFKAKGLWVTDISDINLAVDKDEPMEITANFVADKVMLDNAADAPGITIENK